MFAALYRHCLGQEPDVGLVCECCTGADTHANTHTHRAQGRTGTARTLSANLEEFSVPTEDTDLPYLAGVLLKNHLW